MKFCYITNFLLPKQSQRSRSVLQDGSRSLVLFWKENTPTYNRRNTVLVQYMKCLQQKYGIRYQPFKPLLTKAFGCMVKGQWWRCNSLSTGDENI